MGFGCEKFLKIHFSHFCLKNEGDQVSSQADFEKLYQQISKMTLSGSGRSFNLKSHQRRTHYLHPFQNGSRSPKHGAIVAPPPTGIHCKCFSCNLSGLYSCPCISCSPVVIFGNASCTYRMLVTFTVLTFVTFALQRNINCTSDIRKFCGKKM